jgi:CheY-like chemotaxis protein
MVKDDFEAQEQTLEKKSKYSLILMDCNMPGMDGFETTEQIRQYLYSKNAEQPIISAVTGHMEQMYVDKAIMSGMN